MQRVLLALVLASACIDAPMAPASVPPAEAAHAADPANPATPPESPAAEDEGNQPRFKLTLRSTPPGADVTIDGRRAGVTPLVVEVRADGRAHDFSFALAGYQPWRVKFPPARDGVVHAALRVRKARR